MVAGTSNRKSGTSHTNFWCPFVSNLRVRKGHKVTHELRKAVYQHEPAKQERVFHRECRRIRGVQAFLGQATVFTPGIALSI
jgi:hypothetical protein